jgi:hypothetical protein
MSEASEDPEPLDRRDESLWQAYATAALCSGESTESCPGWPRRRLRPRRPLDDEGRRCVMWVATHPMPFDATVSVLRYDGPDAMAPAVQVAMDDATEIALAYFGRWNAKRIDRVTWCEPSMWSRATALYALAIDGRAFWIAEAGVAEMHSWWVTEAATKAGPYR